MTPTHGPAVVIDVRVDDLAFYEGEAIARPVNALLGATTPVMRKLEIAAGETFARTVRVSEPMQVGSAVVTAAGDLRVELLIHGVVSSDEEPATRATVRRALLSALQRAASFQIRELAMAPFGLGAGNLDIEDSAEIMREVIAEHSGRAAWPERVIVIAENALEEQVLRTALAPRGDR